MRYKVKNTFYLNNIFYVGTMSENSKLVSIIILTYNCKNDLPDCLPNIIKQSYPNKEIIVVDNCSTDGTASFIKTNYLEIRVVESDTNLGYPGGNNYGVTQAKGEYIVIVNPDTIPHNNWLEELIKPLNENPDIAITTSKILIYDNNDLINTCGNYSHFTGLDFCRGLSKDSSNFNIPEELGAFSGCSFAIRREAFENIGGFDADFFLYEEDVDLSWRARLLGYKIMFVPTSIIYHKYMLTLQPWKEYYLERNRHIMLLKNYSLKMLILAIPALIVTEIVTTGYAIYAGIPYILNKLRAYWWIFLNINGILHKRSLIQKNRRISDKEFTEELEWRVPFEQVVQNKVLYLLVDSIFNTFYKIYFIIIKTLI